jgi:hypothetical protein
MPLLKFGVAEEEERRQVKFLIYILLCFSKQFEMSYKNAVMKYMDIYSEQRNIQVRVDVYG